MSLKNGSSGKLVRRTLGGVRDRGMSQSLMYHAFGVREGYKYRRTKYVEGQVEFHLDARLDKACCP